MYTRWETVVLSILWTLGNVSAQVDLQTPLVYQSNSTTASCNAACTSLRNTLGEKVFYQALPAELFQDYFSAQQIEIRPLCLVLPVSAEDVSDAVKIITQHDCIFAVKSGGHAIFSGASNAENGITLDLRHLNEISLSEDQQTVSIGPGNRWGRVYAYLNQWNLTVTGGRDTHVGVAGFLLGGGISFISRRYGWGLDNVRNYELVLANGSISSISQLNHPDLYWALRGGGNNFGIVTRFDMEAHPLTPMWGGCNIIPIEGISDHLIALEIPRSFTWTLSSLLEQVGSVAENLACYFGYCVTVNAFVDSLEKFALDVPSDPYAHAYGVIVKLTNLNRYLYVIQLNHGLGLPNPPAFGKLNGLKYLKNSNRIANQTSFADEISGLTPVRDRATYRTATFRFSADLVRAFMGIYLSEIDPIRHTKAKFGGGMPFMIISKDEIAHFSKNGGNALGIKEADGPLLLISTSFLWKSKDDDDAIYTAAKNIIDRCVALGKEKGLHHPFIYQNYAAKDQDVFEGYGFENRQRLRTTQKKYDPEGVFTSRLNPGYHKV